MRSEAIGGLRAWTKDRLGQQEQQLRTVERSVARLGELDDERERTLADMQTAVDRLGEMGLDESRLAQFVGTDLTALRSAASGRRARRRPSPSPSGQAPTETPATGGVS